MNTNLYHDVKNAKFDFIFFFGIHFLQDQKLSSILITFFKYNVFLEEFKR